MKHLLILLALLAGVPGRADAQSKGLLLTWDPVDPAVTSVSGWAVYYAFGPTPAGFPAGWTRVPVSTNAWSFTNTFTTNLALTVTATNAWSESDPAPVIVLPAKPGKVTGLKLTVTTTIVP